MCVCGGGGGGGEERVGGKRERERPICLGADNPSYYPKAEVETTPPGLFLSNFIYMLLLFSN